MDVNRNSYAEAVSKVASIATSEITCSCYSFSTITKFYPTFFLIIFAKEEMSQLYQILHYHNFSILLNMKNFKLDIPHILKNKNCNFMINKNSGKWLNISKETFQDIYHFVSKYIAIMHNVAAWSSQTQEMNDVKNLPPLGHYLSSKVVFHRTGGE